MIEGKIAKKIKKILAKRIETQLFERIIMLQRLTSSRNRHSSICYRFDFRFFRNQKYNYGAHGKGAQDT